MRRAAFALALLLTCSAWAQSRYDNVPIEAGEATTQPAGQEVTSQRADAGGASLWRIGLSLAGVIALILLARPALRKITGTSNVGERSLVRVLTRTTIGPRQQVLVLSIGRTIMVVGDSGGKLSPLGTIDDPEEAARLLGMVAPEGDGQHADDKPITRPFANIFRRQQQAYEMPEAAADFPADDAVVQQSTDADGEMNQAQQELAGLLRRVRALQDEVHVER